MLFYSTEVLYDQKGDPKHRFYSKGVMRSFHRCQRKGRRSCSVNLWCRYFFWGRASHDTLSLPVDVQPF